MSDDAKKLRYSDDPVVDAIIARSIAEADAKLVAATKHADAARARMHGDIVNLGQKMARVGDNFLGNHQQQELRQPHFDGLDRGSSAMPNLNGSDIRATATRNNRDDAQGSVTGDTHQYQPTANLSDSPIVSFDPAWSDDQFLTSAPAGKLLLCRAQCERGPCAINPDRRVGAGASTTIPHHVRCAEIAADCALDGVPSSAPCPLHRPMNHYWLCGCNDTADCPRGAPFKRRDALNITRAHRAGTSSRPHLTALDWVRGILGTAAVTVAIYAIASFIMALGPDRW